MNIYLIIYYSEKHNSRISLKSIIWPYSFCTRNSLLQTIFMYFILIAWKFYIPSIEGSWILSKVVKFLKAGSRRFAHPLSHVKSNTISTRLQLSLVMIVLSLYETKKICDWAIFSVHSRSSISSSILCKTALHTDLLSTRFDLLEADKNMEIAMPFGD